MLNRILLTSGIAAIALCASPTLQSCSSTQPASEQMSDATITSKIKAKYVADPEINPFNISVETEEGIVYLTGRVKTQGSKDEAEQLARDTDGVRQVVNNIQVGDRTN